MRPDDWDEKKLKMGWAHSKMRGGNTVNPSFLLQCQQGKPTKIPRRRKNLAAGGKYIYILKLQIGAIIMDAGDGGKCGSGFFSFFRPFRPALNAHLCRPRLH